MQDVEVTIGDATPPSVSITGGSITTPAGTGAIRTCTSASDASGVQSVESSRRPSAGREPMHCDWARPRPCEDEAGSLTIPAERSRAMAPTADVESPTPPGTGAGIEVGLIDQTPPGQALDPRHRRRRRLALSNEFAVGWRNPSQSASPIGAVHYAMCPAADLRRATGAWEGVARGRDITAPISGSRGRVSGDSKLWLEDEAGNADRERAVPRVCSASTTTPPAVSIAPLTDRGSDPRAGHRQRRDLGRRRQGASKPRRDGEDAWRSLPTTRDGDGFSATLDDERCRGAGTSSARAPSTGPATSGRRSDSRTASAATRTLPLRIATRLAVGRPKRVARAEREREAALSHGAAGPAACAVRPDDSAPRSPDDARRQPARRRRYRGLGASEAPVARRGATSACSGPRAPVGSGSRRCGARAGPCGSAIPARRRSARARPRSTSASAR